MSPSLEQTSNAARKKILNSLKAAQDTSNGPIPVRDRSVRVFKHPDDLLATFRLELEKIKGTVIEVNDDKELVTSLIQLKESRQWKNLFCVDAGLISLFEEKIEIVSDQNEFTGMEAGITRCEFLIARTGSVLVSAGQPSGRLMNIFPPVHIVLAKASQLVPFLEEAMDGITERYASQMPSQLTVITGASRTADIEKTLVMGAHGPRELIVIVNAKA